VASPCRTTQADLQSRQDHSLHTRGRYLAATIQLHDPRQSWGEPSADVTLTIVEICEQPSPSRSRHDRGGQPSPSTCWPMTTCGGPTIGIVASPCPTRQAHLHATGRSPTPRFRLRRIDDFTYTIGNGHGDSRRRRVTVEVTPATSQHLRERYTYRRRSCCRQPPPRPSHATSALGRSRRNWLKSTANAARWRRRRPRPALRLADGTRLAHEMSGTKRPTQLGAWVRVPELSADQRPSTCSITASPTLPRSEAQPQSVWQDISRSAFAGTGEAAEEGPTSRGRHACRSTRRQGGGS
jgi:hypothetical protein